MNQEMTSEKIPFFWRWLYPIILLIIWGGILGVIIIFSQGRNSDEPFLVNFFGAFIAGSIISLVLFIIFETPINKIIQLVANIPYVGLVFIFPWLLYWLFVWPIVLIDKLLALIIELRYRAVLTNKSWR